MVVDLFECIDPLDRALDEPEDDVEIVNQEVENDPDIAALVGTSAALTISTPSQMGFLLKGILRQPIWPTQIIQEQSPLVQN